MLIKNFLFSPPRDSHKHLISLSGEKLTKVIMFQKGAQLILFYRITCTVISL